MFRLLEILTLILVSIAMALSLAHALELPGKLRLKREAYLAMQSIYYPGFTYGGASEPISILAVVALLVLKPVGSSEFWITLAALIALASMHAVFWLVTQPVNRFWLAEEVLDPASERFFGAREVFNSKRRRTMSRERPRDKRCASARAGVRRSKSCTARIGFPASFHRKSRNAWWREQAASRSFW
jgi:hypothetical protein